MSDPEWRANVLFLGSRVLGWIGYELANQMWYARTAGTVDNPVVRGEFDNEQSAKDFLQFITTVENT
jgi:hypothetical protein